jgi:hypothetical protein
MGNELNRHFSNKEGQMANKIWKQCSLSLEIKQWKNQNYTKISPRPSQNGNHQETNNSKCWPGYVEKTLCTVSGNVN